MIGSWEPSEREREYADLYGRAVEKCQTDGAPATPESITKAMRELGDGIVHDSITHDDQRRNPAPEARTEGSGSGGNDRQPPKTGWEDFEGPDNPELPRRARNHILDGEGNGQGGHRYGTVPSPGRKKRWFPQTWTDDEIIGAVWEAVRNPIVVTSSGLYFNCYAEHRGVRIKVQVLPNGEIRTGYPLDGAGVVQAHAKADGSIETKPVPYGASAEVEW